MGRRHLRSEDSQSIALRHTWVHEPRAPLFGRVTPAAAVFIVPPSNPRVLIHIVSTGPVCDCVPVTDSWIREIILLVGPDRRRCRDRVTSGNPLWLPHHPTPHPSAPNRLSTQVSRFTASTSAKTLWRSSALHLFIIQTRSSARDHMEKSPNENHLYLFLQDINKVDLRHRVTDLRHRLCISSKGFYDHNMQVQKPPEMHLVSQKGKLNSGNPAADTVTYCNVIGRMEIIVSSWIPQFLPEIRFIMDCALWMVIVSLWMLLIEQWLCHHGCCRSDGYYVIVDAIVWTVIVSTRMLQVYQ